MSSTAATPSVSDFLNAADWAYAQAGTPYAGPDTSLPAGFSYFLYNGQPLIDYVPSAGFYGAAVVNATGQIIVAFEGTNVATGNAVFTFAQGLDDLAITAGVDAPSYSVALSFTDQVLADAASEQYTSSQVFLAGHSLGGAEAEYVSAQTGLSGTTFGAPGIPSSDIPAGSTAQFTDYVERGDPVGNYAQGGNLVPMLQNPDVEHFGTATYIGSYAGTALLLSADATYIAAINAPTRAEQLAGLTAASLILASAVPYHYLSTYAGDLPSATLSGPDRSIEANGTGGLLGASANADTLSSSDPTLSLVTTGEADIPGYNVTAAGALTLAPGAVELNLSNGTHLILPEPGSTGHTYSLSGDGEGGTILRIGAASDGYVLGGVDGVTTTGDAASLDVIGGSGAVSVRGGSGDLTVSGATSSSATTFAIGGSGTNLLYGGAGATTIAAGIGASTLISGAGTTLMMTNGSASDYVVAGSGPTSVFGGIGTGNEQIFAGSGSDVIGLGSGADTMIAGSGVTSVVGGSGQDIYGFINGHAGGSEIIEGLKANDSIVFGGYNGDPITSEGVLNGSDLLTLSDGTAILLLGIDHKVFT